MSTDGKTQMGTDGRHRWAQIGSADERRCRAHYSSSDKAHYNTHYSINRPWVKVIALIVIAAFLWQDAACAYSYKGNLAAPLKPLFKEESWGDVCGELVKYAVISAVSYGAFQFAGQYVASTQAGFWGSAAAYGAAGAFSGGFAAGVNGGDISDVGRGALIGGVTGGVTGGIGSVRGWSGASGALYGAGTGTAIGAGAGYLLHGKEGAWMYGIQGGIGGGIAGYNTPQTTGTDKYNLMDDSYHQAMNKECPYGYIGNPNSGDNTSVFAQNTSFNSNASETPVYNNWNLSIPSGYGGTTNTGTLNSAYRLDNLFTSNGTIAGDITAKYMGRGTTSGADPYNTYNPQSGTYTNYAVNTPPSNYATNCQSTWGQTSTNATTTTQSTLAKTWNAVKSSPATREIIQGMGTAMIMDDVARAVAGEIYLDTVDWETGEYDEEKAEFWATVACGAVGGMLNAPDILGLEELPQGQSFTDVLKTMGQGMAVGTMTGLGSAYAVRSVRHHFFDKNDEREMERFNTLKPAISLAGGIVGHWAGKGAVDWVGTGMEKVGLFEHQGPRVDVGRKQKDSFEVTGTVEQIQPLLEKSNSNYSVSDTGRGTCIITVDEPQSIRDLAGDAKNAQELGIRRADVLGAFKKPINEFGQTRGAEFNATSQLNVDVNKTNERGNIEVISWTDKNGTLNVVSITPEDKHKFGNQTSLTKFAEQAYGHGDSAKDFVSDIKQSPSVSTPGKGIEKGIVYDKISLLQIGKGKDYRLPLGQAIGDKHVELHKNEGVGVGRATLNILSAPGKGIANEWWRLAGTLADSYAARTMQKKAESTGNYKWAQYANVVGETANFTVSTLAYDLGCNVGGLIYRDPLDKLAYNIHLKNELNKVARAKDEAMGSYDKQDYAPAVFKEPYDRSPDNGGTTFGYSNSRSDGIDHSDGFHKYDPVMTSATDGSSYSSGSSSEYASVSYVSRIEDKSPDEAMKILGKSKLDFAWDRAKSNIGQNFLSRTVGGAVTVYLDDVMAKKAPEYWGGQSKRSRADFDTKEEFQEWRANQQRNRAFTLNLASSLIHGIALSRASGDKDINTERFPVRNDEVEIGGWLFSAQALKENAGAKLDRDKGTLTIYQNNLETYLKENDYAQQQAKVAETWGEHWTVRTVPVENNFISTADRKFDADLIVQNSDNKITREGNFIVIPHAVLQENKNGQFTKQWAMTDKPAGFGENVFSAMGGSQMAAAINGLSFGYSGIYKEGDTFKHRQRTSFEWVRYANDARNISGVFSSKANMRNYWAGVYKEGTKANFAGTVATFQPVADFFGVMPERGVIRPITDAKHPEQAGYRIYFKNITYPQESAFVRPWYYQGPYPKMLITPEALEQLKAATKFEPPATVLPKTSISTGGSLNGR